MGRRRLKKDFYEVVHFRDEKIPDAIVREALEVKSHLAKKYDKATLPSDDQFVIWYYDLYSEIQKTAKSAGVLPGMLEYLSLGAMSVGTFNFVASLPDVWQQFWGGLPCAVMGGILATSFHLQGRDEIKKAKANFMAGELALRYVAKYEDLPEENTPAQPKAGPA